MGSRDLFQSEYNRAMGTLNLIHTNCPRVGWPLQSTPDRVPVTIDEHANGGGPSPRQD
jgi:hypothetical protein